LLRWATVWSQ